MIKVKAIKAGPASGKKLASVRTILCQSCPRHQKKILKKYLPRYTLKLEESCVLVVKSYAKKQPRTAKTDAFGFSTRSDTTNDPTDAKMETSIVQERKLLAGIQRFWLYFYTTPNRRKI